MKPPRFMQSRDFWFAISLLVLALVSARLYLSNRAVINDLRGVVVAQQHDLEKICNTTTTLDIALVGPLLLETNHAIRDLPGGAYRQRILRFRNNLQVAHEALSETQSCESVR